MPSLYNLSEGGDALGILLDDIEQRATEESVRCKLDAIPFDPSAFEEESRTAIESAMDAMGDEVAVKVDNIIGYSRELTAMADVRKAEADRMAGLARRDEDRAKRIKDLILRFMEAQGIDKLNTSRYNVSVANNGGVVPLVWDDPKSKVTLLPDEYVMETVNRFPDDALIRRDLEAGKDIPGVRMGERGKNLRVK